MALQVIEGTWEEIKRHEPELIGQFLRVIIKPMPQKQHKSFIPAKKAPYNTAPPRVSAMGKYAGILSTEDFMREKQEEIDLEDRVR